MCCQIICWSFIPKQLCACGEGAGRKEGCIHCALLHYFNLKKIVTNTILMCQTDIPEMLILVITFHIQNAEVAVGLVGRRMTHHLPEFVQKFPLISTLQNQNIFDKFMVFGKSVLRLQCLQTLIFPESQDVFACRNTIFN